MKYKNLEKADNFIKELLKNPEVKKEYDLLAPRYALINKIIEARIKKKITQKELAKRMETKQSAIARFESGDINPTFDFAQRLANALNTKINVTFNG
jgi:ribosome-binding protein aMBF1 (putative translation factor)